MQWLAARRARVGHNASGGISPASPVRSRFDPLPHRLSLRLRSPARPSPSECAKMHLTPAGTIYAPARSTAKALASANTIEHYVGRQVAVAAAILLEALAERSDGALTPATRTRGGDQLAALYGLAVL